MVGSDDKVQTFSMKQVALTFYLCIHNSSSFKTNSMYIECFLLRKWTRCVKPHGAELGLDCSGQTLDDSEFVHLFP